MSGDFADSNATASLELRYSTIGQYTAPSRIRETVSGNGWFFWARETVEIDYNHYKFSSRPLKKTPIPIAQPQPH